MENLHKKTIANAISAYLLIGINWAFLFNKDNEYTNNSFVKSHTKTALFIHLLYILNIVVFVWNSPFPVFSILGYSISDIVAIVLFFILTAILFLGIYKARSGEYFYTKDIISLTGDKKLLDINGDLKINEKDKLTLMLAHVPFIGAYMYGKYAKYEVVQSIGKVNLYITSLALLLYIGGNNNLATLLVLGYIIYIIFSGIQLFTSSNLLQFHLNQFPTPSSLRILALTSIKYLKNYFSRAKFVAFKTLHANTKKSELIARQSLEKSLQAITKGKMLQKYRIYIENFSMVFVILLVILVSGMNNNWILILLLSAIYTLGYVKYSLSYKTPFIHDIYTLTQMAFMKTKRFFIQTKKLHQKEEVNTMKIK